MPRGFMDKASKVLLSKGCFVYIEDTLVHERFIDEHKFRLEEALKKF